MSETQKVRRLCGERRAEAEGAASVEADAAIRRARGGVTERMRGVPGNGPVSDAAKRRVPAREFWEIVRRSLT